ncbi:MAG: helix-turn-helix transcriptional regulator [Ruminococcaceae bacterium]|nr:helix-turn-helix transcriptional regulator [Oscillospiraceae bacterium]
MEQTLGKRIAENRKKLKLTQDQLAEQLGVTAQAVSKWENDQSCPDIATLPRLAEIFGISIDALLGHNSQETVHQGEIVEDEEDHEKDGIHVNKGKWEFHWDSGRRGALAMAFWVLLVGGLLLASRLLSWDVGFWDILWPTFLLIFGLDGLFRKFTLFRSCMVLFGGYYLVSNLGLWSLDIGDELVWPIIIVMFGLSLLFDALKKPKKHQFHIHRHGDISGKTDSHHHEEGEHFDTSLSFGENSHIVDLDRVSSGNATVSFGELKIDLTQCEEIADGCRLDVKCSFAQMILLVPKHCRVISNVRASMGAVEFDGQPDADAETTIYVDGHVSFGDLSIRYI